MISSIHILYESFSNNSIWPRNDTLIGITNENLGKSRNNGNETVLHTSQCPITVPHHQMQFRVIPRTERKKERKKERKNGGSEIDCKKVKKKRQTYISDFFSNMNQKKKKKTRNKYEMNAKSMRGKDYVFTNLSARVRWEIRSIFLAEFNRIWIEGFPSPWVVAIPKLKSPVYPLLEAV